MSDATIRMHEAIARKAGLSGTDHKYLGMLMQSPPMTAGDLARATGLTTGAITGLVDRFEKRKLVRRRYDDEDRRKIYIEPWQENVDRLMGPTFRELQARMEQVMQGFTQAELAIVARYIQGTIVAMQEFTAGLNETKTK
jgi:DNA-binding MarR family transcriptional regulator